ARQCQGLFPWSLRGDGDTRTKLDELLLMAADSQSKRKVGAAVNSPVLDNLLAQGPGALYEALRQAARGRVADRLLCEPYSAQLLVQAWPPPGGVADGRQCFWDGERRLRRLAHRPADRRPRRQVALGRPVPGPVGHLLADEQRQVPLH